MKISSINELKKITENIREKILPGDNIFLFGEIGVGKTTFARFFINHLEKKDKIKISDILSPTYNILYDYNVGHLKILHYDLYRLKNYKDILQLGIFENSKENVKIIEWPELIKPKPKDRVDIIFKYSKLKSSREVKISGFGKWKDCKFDEIYNRSN